MLQRARAARHSTVRRRAACPGPRRDLACVLASFRRTEASCWQLLGRYLDFLGRAREQRAIRAAGGDVQWLGQGLPPPRTAQGRSVGGLEPKVHSLGAAHYFGHLVGSAENARRDSRAWPTAPPGTHQTVAGARRARRGRGKHTRRPCRKGCKSCAGCWQRGGNKSTGIGTVLQRCARRGVWGDAPGL